MAAPLETRRKKISFLPYRIQSQHDMKHPPVHRVTVNKWFRSPPPPPPILSVADRPDYAGFRFVPPVIIGLTLFLSVLLGELRCSIFVLRNNLSHLFFIFLFYLVSYRLRNSYNMLSYIF
jgi:hypothetical protein